MESVSVNQFRDNLRHFVERVISRHDPLKVMRRNGDDFIVISAEDWDREQETLYVLQNADLMKQMEESLKTHEQRAGYRPTGRELDEITDI